MSDYHSYLITSLDLHTVDLDEFKYGGTNITAFRLVDPDKPELLQVVKEWSYGESRFGRKLEPGAASKVGSNLCYRYLINCQFRFYAASNIIFSMSHL